jgi:hypothetical protein
MTIDGRMERCVVATANEMQAGAIDHPPRDGMLPGGFR